jgi:hypothetical protein
VGRGRICAHSFHDPSVSSETGKLQNKDGNLYIQIQDEPYGRRREVEEEFVIRRSTLIEMSVVLM